VDSEATLLAGDGGTNPDRSKDDGDLAKGTILGRYVVLGEVGRGAMGRVYSAYDPRLDRRVALKLLRGGQSSGEAGQRLLREAQALARLNHPNVVAVHDVGELDEQLFVAMEFVEGQTLKDWQREAQRPWQVVLNVYREAALGLAAAHDADIIHRDFKPENVMLELRADGERGRVRVMDFGLAREGPATTTASSSLTSGDVSLTRTGTVLGTPAYMSPEHFAGGVDIGPASDQFSFCVALHEGLFSARPFGGSSLVDLASNVRRGQIKEVPRGTVPGWLVAVLRRGLSVEPDDRFASMHELLAAMDRGAHRQRWVVGSIALVALGGAALGLTATEQPNDQECRTAESELEAAWSEARATTIAQAFSDSGHLRAAQSFARVRSGLDEFADEWVEEYDHVCGAWQRTLEADLLEARRDCLTVQRAHFEGLLEAFDEPSTKAVGFATAATASLPSPSACGEIETLEDAPPADWRDAVIQAQRLLALAQVRRSVADQDGASALLAEALEVLGDRDVPRPRAEIVSLQASVAFSRGDLEQGRQLIEEALALAARGGNKGQLADLWLDRLSRLGQFRAKEDLQRGHLLEAASLFVTMAGDQPKHRARLLSLQGLQAKAENDLATAIERYEQSLAVQGDDLSMLTRSRTLGLLGAALSDSGDLEGAALKMREAKQNIVEHFGDAHPAALTHMGNLGVTCILQGDRACAQQQFEAVGEALKASRREDQPVSATNHTRLASLAYEEADYETARRHARKAVEIFTANGLDGSIDMTLPRGLLARIALVDDKPEEAVEQHRELVRITEESYGADHRHTAAGLLALGAALEAAHQWDEMLSTYQRAHDIFVEHAPTDTVSIVVAKVGVAGALIRLERSDEALQRAEETYEYAERSNVSEKSGAHAKYVLARALHATGGDHERIVSLARSAATSLEAVGGREMAHAEAAKRWLAGITATGTP